MARRKWLGAIGLAAILTLATLVAIDQYGLVDRAQPADVIVVLGSRVSRNGQPSPSLSRRARWAAELYNRGLAPVIICSGGLGENPPTEAEAACSLIQSLGVPQSAIVLETQARSTEETSLYVAAIMRARGWDSAVVVSDGYHLARTAMLFSRASVVVYPSPAQQLSGPMRPVER
ncbi:MAG: YdcF family protein, partial [Chloroflexota bacterium]